MAADKRCRCRDLGCPWQTTSNANKSRCFHGFLKDCPTSAGKTVLNYVSSPESSFSPEPLLTFLKPW
ncbi:hypothetical protein BgiBS90_016027 [Biomphalaria glabrata]|nr:hypothetical protein BgiBS90_016027 [Biomphalaria glabrata]